MALYDIAGKEVKVGDLVAFNRPHYKGVQLGVIKKLNKKQFGVYPLVKENNSYRIEYSRPYNKIESVAVLDRNSINITN